LDGFAPYNVFRWSLGHQNAVIDGHLATYRGIFVGDACGANARLEHRSGGRIVHASCNAHARREFVKAESNDPVLASQGISFYRQLSERTLRPLVVGRGNWLFLGHPDAAPGRMQMYSVVSSAHRHHLVIEDYLEDVLCKLADAEQNHPSDLALDSRYLLDLLPDRWALTHPGSVRQGRIEERETVLDAKRWRRARARIEARVVQASGP
jgi:hypothetical protein